MVIGIETASSSLSVAIVSEDAVIAAIEINCNNIHDEWLPIALQQVIDFAGIAADDLKVVAVSAGPGSFTGLRIGMAAAKGIALAQDIPLIAVPTFDAIAHRAARLALRTGSHRLATAFDAKREDVYFGVYEIIDGKATQIEKATADTAENVSNFLKKGTFLAGDGASKIHAIKIQDFVMLHGFAPATHAADVALLGTEMLSQGNIADRATCEPIYVRTFQTTVPKPIV